MYRSIARAFCLGLLLLPGLTQAESEAGMDSASARLKLTVVVPPVFVVLASNRVPGGMEYRVWTNMRTVFFQNREHVFSSVGESILHLQNDELPWIVHGL